MTTGELMTLPARRGRAQRLTKGQSIKIINTHGQQVVDTWCFSAEDLTEFMSMEHMRPTIGRLWPRKGDALHTNRRRADPDHGGGHFARHGTTPRSPHATTTATACSGCKEYHDNCTDNLRARDAPARPRGRRKCRAR